MTSLLVLLALAPAADGDFQRDIRPILADNCFSCHGPDEKSRKADLRLDIKGGLTDPKELVARITSNDPQSHMPPAKSGKKLSPAQIAALNAWADRGAPWASHWAFDPPQRPAVPVVPNAHHPIDAFILARLNAEGLQPSPEADKATLARRLFLDLTGLPPTPEQVDAFLADTSMNAYERLVDRLLASPHYGERMAVNWLDGARFADSNGYQSDDERYQWPWRDWVIRAFNSNKPFDQFTVEQTAGDMLPNATPEQQLATGFHRNHRINSEGGIIPEEWRVETIIDRVETTSAVWLGLTMGCARCHDHKFDPVSQREFYQFYSFFNNVPESGMGIGKEGNTPPLVRAPRPEDLAKLRELEAAIVTAEANSRTAPPPGVPVWTVPKPTAMKAEGGGTLVVQRGGSVQVGGANPATDVYTLTLPVTTAVSGLRLEVLPDDTHPEKWLAGSVNGNFVLGNVGVEADGKPVKLASATADFSQANYPIGNVIDAAAGSGWAVHPKTAEPHTATFAFAEKVSPQTLQVTLRFASGFEKHQFRHFRLSVTDSAMPHGTAKVPDAVTLAKKAKTDFEASMPSAMVLAELPTPRDAFILMRGQYDQRGEKVTAGLPAALPPMPRGQPMNRLGLARWLTAPENPLTARVFVNRMWEKFFGVGLVKTSENFGLQGDAPSHPALLDWLATRFVDSGWDMKAIQKTIVMSQTYRQSSKLTPAMLERDPENRLVARGPRFRLQGELVRDNALAISGLLVPTVGGPSVRPYQPKGVWDETNFYGNLRNYQHEKGDGLYRRTMYTIWKRTAAPPTMLLFDSATREVCTVKRARTNTPLQALVLLNEVTFVEASRALAERMMAAGTTPAERIAHGFRRATAREPEPAELDLLVAGFTRRLESFRKNPEKAKQFLAVGERKSDATLDAVELAAYATSAGVILNLDETITRE